MKEWRKKCQEWRKNCKEWLAEGHRASWLVFALFALLFFLQTLLFDHFAFRELELNPSAQNRFAMLLSKFAASLLFASLTFIIRDKR